MTQTQSMELEEDGKGTRIGRGEKRDGREENVCGGVNRSCREDR